MKPIYTKPKCYKGTGVKKEWYVWFRYNRQLIKKTYDLNRIKDIKERTKEADDICRLLLQKLKKGYNPLVPDMYAVEGTDMTLFQSMEYGLEKKKPNICAKTYSGYNGTVKFCKKAIEALNLGHLSIADTKRVHIKTIMETATKQRCWSNAAYNKNLNYLKAVLNELLQWDIIAVNPAHRIANKPVYETHANITATPTQQKEIKYFLQKKHPDFYTFIITIFHTGIRPVELTRIKMNMVDLKNMQIVLPAHITKTKKERVVPINPHLYKLIAPMFEVNHKKDWFLFGSHRPPGEGNRGAFKDFIPGPTQIMRDTATKRWEKLIKRGLGINVNLYSMKHLGADMKILAGVELSAIKELYGHDSELTTEIYARKVKQVYRNQIMEKSPDF